MAIKITRKEYEAKFGIAPKVSNTVVSTPQASTGPVKITRAEYESKFGIKPTNKPLEQSVNASSGTGYEGLYTAINKQGSIGVGIGKGVANTITSLREMGNNIASQTVGRVANAIMGNGFTAPTNQGNQITPQVPEAFTRGTESNTNLTKPINQEESLGYGVEKIAEFILPSGQVNAVSKAGQGLIKGAGIVSKLARGGVKAGTEALSSGAISTVQEGEINDAVKTNAIIGGLFSAGGSIAGEAIDLTGKALKKGGEKIQTAVIKPSRADELDGFKIENIKKYNLGGSNEQVLAKSSIKLNDLSEQLKKKLKSSNVSLNLNNIYEETVNALSGGKAKNFGNIKGTDRVLQALKSEIEEVAGPNGLVSVPDAQLVKQGAGTKGSWVFGSADPDASAVEKVYNTFYNRLKNRIEDVSPKEVAEINKQISELIPIQKAVIRRIPVENRNAVIGFNEGLALFGSVFNPKALALIGASKLSKSGKFGSFLVNVSDKIKAPRDGAIGQRVFGQDSIQTPKANPITSPTTNPIINNKANITPSLQKGATPVNTAIDSTLIGQAKKYKSADEFVKGISGAKNGIGTGKYGKSGLDPTEIGSWSIQDIASGKSPLQKNVSINELKLSNQQPDIFLSFKESGANGNVKDGYTIYRVTPKGGSINAGDFVFSNEKSAIAFLEDYGYKRGQTEIQKIDGVKLDELLLPKTEKEFYRNHNSSMSYPVDELIYAPKNIQNIGNLTKSQLTDIWNKANSQKGSASIDGILGGAVGATALATTLGGGTSSEYKAPEQSKGAIKLGIPYQKIGDALMNLESSGGKNNANQDGKEMKWLVGLTDLAIKELKNAGFKGEVDINDKEDVIDAGIKYFLLMQMRHPEKSPGEIYADYYWTQAKSPEQRQKKIEEFDNLINQ